MKKLLLFSIMMIAVFASSCEDDKEGAKTPVLGELTLSPNPCYQGDTITATITIADEGSNSSFFKFTINYNDKSLARSKGEFSRDSQNRVVFKFTAPKVNGQLNVSVYGTANLYAGDKLYGTTNTVKSSVNIQELDD